MQPVIGKPIRILLIDGQSIVSACLRLLLENKPGLKVVGETPKSYDAFIVARDEHPDIILLDIDKYAQEWKRHCSMSGTRGIVPCRLLSSGAYCATMLCQCSPSPPYMASQAG
jgi:DNA-binding NarL/FixJ family response regulator